jgi:trans-aconitate methyltransferase
VDSGGNFDLFAESYDQALEQGISVSGEGRDYFAEGRVTFLSDCLRTISFAPAKVMDFGCGTGATAPFLLDCLHPQSLLGLDVSAESISVARRQSPAASTRFETFTDYIPAADVDLIYSNGVFHHIQPEKRPAALDLVWRALRPGGLFALWENNPWNPGTRYVMSRIPFDRDAVTLSAPEACRMLRASNFEVRRVDFLFIFPRILKWLRPLERRLSRLPLGAQYQVLACKAL